METLLAKLSLSNLVISSIVSLILLPIAMLIVVEFLPSKKMKAYLASGVMLIIGVVLGLTSIKFFITPQWGGVPSDLLEHGAGTIHSRGGLIMYLLFFVPLIVGPIGCGVVFGLASIYFLYSALSLPFGWIAIAVINFWKDQSIKTACSKNENVLKLTGIEKVIDAKFFEGITHFRIAEKFKDERHLAKAKRLLLENAEKNHAMSQLALTRIYHDEGDLVEAYKWYYLGSQGSSRDNSKIEDLIKDQVTLEQIEEAKCRASEWMQSIIF